MVDSIGRADVTQLLVAAMSTSEKNHRVLANNIANADTPGFTPQQLDFQRVLRATLDGRGGAVLRTGHPRHQTLAVSKRVLREAAQSSRNDFNKVNLDQELAALSENTSKYVTYATLLNKRFEQYRNTLQSLSR
jgi:flagellar basal-body rod protein FlgB